MGGRSQAGPRTGERRWWARGPLLVVLLATALRVHSPGPPIFTVDELLWTARSDRFATALDQRDFASANVGPADAPATRPGVTTMWIGVLGEQIADADPLDRGTTELRWTHALMGLTAALMLWPFVLLTARLVGRRAAVVAGGLVAVEPLMVGHSSIQHTDALITMTCGVAAVGLIAAFEAARGQDRAGPARWWRAPSVRLGALTGAFAALAFLTKLSAAPLLGPLVVTVLGVHLALGQRAGRTRPFLRDAARVLVPAAAVFVLVAVALWPALWVDPIANLRSTLSSGDLASAPSRHLFLGDIETTGDWRFYAVELWFRTSPWLLVGGAASLGWVLVRWVRRSPRAVPRRVSLPLVVPAVVYALVISASEKQYGRYLLPLLPLAAVGVGVVADQLLRARVLRRAGRVGWAGLAAAGVFTAALAPHAISFVDPLVGGQRRAERSIQLGWGEGQEVVVAEYHRRRGGTCAPWSGVGPWLIACPSQPFDWLDDGQVPPPRYVLLYVTSRQLGFEPPGLRTYLSEHGRLVRSVRIDGVSYAEMWELG